MLDHEALKNLLHSSDFTRLDKLLLCLAVNEKPKSVLEIKGIAKASGLRKVDDWNVSAILSSSDGKAVRTTDGWELTNEGKSTVQVLAGPKIKTTVSKLAASLRSHLAKISDTQIQSFVDEAIRCYEQEYYRAAVVLSWVGAVSILYKHVIANELSNFNSEARKRSPKWKDAKKSDDLARMKEYDFLQILEAISVIGKNVKGELENCLALRNGCGHPSSLVVGESRVSAHIEILILNVFSKF